jgi:hypothetical protein
MPEILLTKGYTSFIDEVDADLASFKWCISIAHSSRYATRTDYSFGKRFPKKLLLHRVIAERMIGRPLVSGEIVDHVNGESLVNTRQNLRVVTNAQNQWNAKRPSHNTSGFKGVSFNRKDQKWVAYIHLNKKHVHLGYFETPEAAYEAYCAAARKYFGEFARFE